MIRQRREKLKIVFKMDCEPEPSGTDIGSIKMERYVQSNGMDGVEALKTIIGITRSLGMATQFNDHGKNVSTDAYLREVEKQGKWTRTVEIEGLLLRYGRVPSLRHSFILIEEVKAGSAISWDEWVKPFIVKSAFVQAWISDVDYDHWQNAKDPVEYEIAGRSYEHLPMKSNGLPPPLESNEIDTSNNPGRWILQQGYVEAIGSTMWLGEPFWKYVGPNRQDLLFSATWLSVCSLENNVLRVVAHDTCFCDESTAEVQNKFREILYMTRPNEKTIDS